MKHIIKSKEPEKFTVWKNQQNENWIPTFDKLSGDEKKAVYTALKAEQGHICCYCESNLETNRFHIEHLKPQHLEDVDPLDFSNMLCSCQANLEKGEPRHCGNQKGEWHDDELLVSPLDPECETKFIYTIDGLIKPADPQDCAAITTIIKLKLDLPKLNDFRKRAIEPFIEDETITDEELIKFKKNYLISKEDNGGKFNEYYTVIKYIFDKYIMNG